MLPTKRKKAVLSNQSSASDTNHSILAFADNHVAQAECAPQQNNATTINMDLMTRIMGLYRLVDLYKQQGSGDLIDKITIARSSLAELMNKLAPLSCASLSKIDFASLDTTSIQPLGIYGDKAALVEFLRIVANVDNETRVKERLLAKQAAVMTCDELPEDQRCDLLTGILHDEKKEDRHAGLPSTVQPFLSVVHETSKMSDQDVLTFLEDSATQKPQLQIFVQEIQDIIYTWAIGLLKEMVSVLHRNIEVIHEEQSESQAKLAKERAKNQVKQGMSQRFIEFKKALQKRLFIHPEGPSYNIKEVYPERPVNWSFSLPKRFTIKGVLEVEFDPYIEYTIYPFHMEDTRDSPLLTPQPHATNFKLGIRNAIRHIQLIGNKILFIVNRSSCISIYLNDPLRIDLDQAIKHFPTSQARYQFCVHEHRHLLAIAYTKSEDEIWVELQSLDESCSSLQAQGSPHNITKWYGEGLPDISHICFAGGPEELCLVESSGRARVFSFISGSFRPAMLQLPYELNIHSVYSAPDDSAMIVLEEIASDYQLRVYHWNSFGHLPQGCILPFPDGVHIQSATSCCFSSMGQRSNAVLLALLEQNMIRCFNILIKSKGISDGSYSRDKENSEALASTAHNSFIDCYSDVWTVYPLEPAIKRKNLSSEKNIVASSLTFVCNLETQYFSPYFRRMISNVERLTRKPGKRIFDAIEVHADVIENLDWRSFEAAAFKAGEWFVELFCLIPIQIAIAQNNCFIPLKNGVSDSLQDQKLADTRVNQIADSITLGWYESIFNSYMATKPVKVVSAIGEPNVGNSFTLNHMIDSSFAVSALPTTEGVWLSVCPTHDFLVVALDFEGLHTIKRYTQVDHDVLLVLFSTALSNMVIFRNNFGLNHDMGNTFTSFQASTTLLDPVENPKLFKSLLTVIIRDVVKGEEKKILNEFSSKLDHIISDEGEANFISVLHASQIKIIPGPVIRSRSFYTFISVFRDLLLKQPTTHTTAGEFLLTLKMLMAMLKAQDWGAIDHNLTRQRVKLLISILPCAMSTGFSQVEPEVEELKNLDNQGIIPWGDDSRNIVFCLSKSPAERAVSLLTISNGWKCDPARHDLNELTEHIDKLVSARVGHIDEWIRVNTSRFPNKGADLKHLMSAFKDHKNLLYAGVQLCRVDCSECRLPCILPKAHKSGNHNCQTSHQCLARCEYLDVHDQKKDVFCELPAGHAGRHLCGSPTHSFSAQLDEGHLSSTRNYQLHRTRSVQAPSTSSAESSSSSSSLYTVATEPSVSGRASASTTAEGWNSFISFSGNHIGRYRKRTGEAYAQGGFSDVWKCDVSIGDNAMQAAALKELRAVKIPVTKSDPQSVHERMIKRLERELVVWSRLQHPHVVPLIGFCLVPPNLISPWFSNGNIKEWIRKHEGVDRYKLDNVLINDEGHAAVNDFGLSQVMENSGSTITNSMANVGNARWLAPEIFCEDMKRSTASDVYAFGCLMLEIATGALPFRKLTDKQVLRALLCYKSPATDRSMYPELPENDPLWKLMSDCWDSQYEARPEMKEVEDRLQG
ncbi:hypothetical protein FRC03_011241 [Tulasnella sp. 419]|nr:hypothetical protein FRC03_011241 [Tulasnella sp. 419]